MNTLKLAMISSLFLLPVLAQADLLNIKDKLEKQCIMEERKSSCYRFHVLNLGSEANENREEIHRLESALEDGERVAEIERSKIPVLRSRNLEINSDIDALELLIKSHK